MSHSLPSSNGDNRFERAFTVTAQSLLATLILFAVVNGVLFLVPSLRTTTAVKTPLDFLGADRFLPAYPGWTRDALIDLHDESRVVFTYEPVVEFRIKPIAGKYVNATPHGFRLNAKPAPWPMDPAAFNVFVFGGSTTFGWLLADGDTIVSHLQDDLLNAGCSRPVHVYNFGHPSYISTQETLLFQILARRGIVPDTAVFVDGLNEFVFRGEMSFTNALRTMMEETDTRRRLGSLVDLPMYQLARRVWSRASTPPVPDPAAEQRFFERIITQWRGNKTFAEAIGRQYGVSTLFVWQPVSAFKYDLTRHFLNKDGIPDPVPYAQVGRGYEAMQSRRAELEREGNFLWLADMQEGRRENLYVDRVHYSAAFARDIAGEIARRLLPTVSGCAE